MKSAALWFLLAVPATLSLQGCAGVARLGLPWVEQGPGITPEEGRARASGRTVANTPANTPANTAASAQTPAMLKPAEPPPQASAGATPPVTMAAVAPPATMAAVTPREPQTEPVRRGAGFPQASRYGDLLFLSGQIPLDFRTREVAATASPEEQAWLTLENIRTVLEVHGLTAAQLVSTTVYLKNINDLAAVDAAYARFFKGAPPSRTVVEVARLPRGVLLEISAIAGR